MKVSRDFMRFYLIPVILFVGILLVGAFSLFYTATAQTEAGKIVSSNWPKDFTLGFSRYLTCSDRIISLSPEGEDQLKANDLWLQVLDPGGTEVMAFEKPERLPASYRPYELLELYQKGDGDFSIFVGTLEGEGEFYTYLIGFPLDISKVVMYVDTPRYQRGKILIIATMVLTVLLLLGVTVFYNTVILRNLERICSSLKAVAERTYTPGREKRFLREVYHGIDLLDQDLTRADERRSRDEKAKEEWLANISHDLKTPLAPIRGYAELLAEGQQQAPDEVQRYGAVMLKNVLYTQELIDDLKLAYQLQSDMLPLQTEVRSIAGFVREVIIDILNSPEYEERTIGFVGDDDFRRCHFDPQLLRRALTNVIVNSLKHNKADTEITVTLEGTGEIEIRVADNGGGMTPEELESLFQRYYRGTNTEVKAEGSGLGMAIAKEILEAHGGKIEAKSRLGAGTVITLILPQK